MTRDIEIILDYTGKNKPKYRCPYRLWRLVESFETGSFNDKVWDSFIEFAKSAYLEIIVNIKLEHMETSFGLEIPYSKITFTIKDYLHRIDYIPTSILDTGILSLNINANFWQDYVIDLNGYHLNKNNLFNSITRNIAKECNAEGDSK